MIAVVRILAPILKLVISIRVGCNLNRARKALGVAVDKANKASRLFAEENEKVSNWAKKPALTSDPVADAKPVRSAGSEK